MDSIFAATTLQKIRASELLHQFLPMFVVGLTVSFFTTPIFRRVAIIAGVMDHPKAGIKLHKRTTPYMGGLAIYMGWAAAIVFGLWQLKRSPFDALLSPPQLAGVLLAGTIMVVVGLIDDAVSIAPRKKMVWQLTAGVILIITGTGNEFLDSWLSLFGIDPPRIWLWVLSVPFALLVIAGASNAANLLDGLDGLCAGVTGIIAVSYLILATHLATLQAEPHIDEIRMLICIALLSGVLGFLPYNFNPASIFMGDAGSMLIGVNIAAMMLLFSEHTDPRWFLGSLMIFGLPICDTALAIFRRVTMRRSFLLGDSQHLHHQLVRHGLTTKQTVAVLYVLATFFAMAGLNVLYIRLRFIVVVYAIVIANLVVLATAFGLHRPDANERRALEGNLNRHLPVDDE